MKEVRKSAAFLKLALGVLAPVYLATGAESVKPDILLIVADDLNYDSLGYMGGVAPEVTPNIDALSKQSISFENAFTPVSVCQPSRQSMLTGLLPHSYGSVGFFPIKHEVETLSALLAEAGYLTAVIHKKGHMLPQEFFKWDYDNEALGLYGADRFVGRNPEDFARGLKKLIDRAEDEGAPFLLVANSADPHRPFHGDPIQLDGGFFGNEKLEEIKPSRIYSADEVTIPPALPDLPGVREDLARYASSVRRLDDMVGACLEVLELSGKANSTLVLFVSDNGMPLPFAKFDTYLGSNRTPFLLRLPRGIGAGRSDDARLVSLMDVTPTILEIVGIPVPGGLDGKSLLPIIEGREVENWRDAIVLLRYEDIYYNSGIERRLRNNPEFISDLEKQGWRLRPDHPSKGTYSRERQQRCYFDGRYAYIFNDWHRPDGLEVGPLGVGVPYSDRSFHAMSMAAAHDESVSQRVRRYLLRSLEELYDWTRDPGSLVNLVDDPEFAGQLKNSREKLMNWMKTHKDPLLPAYQAKLNGLPEPEAFPLRGE